ncbi:MAG: shikimate kinase [Flavipsychrobacter sp.]|nr:shikimate kinase [Flavipsychrobacter sp.]
MIFFIGMPGAGKSYWASSLATAYGLPFVDLDVYLEEKVGMSLGDFFDKHGEDTFREEEHKALLEVISRKERNQVVSCGGGTPVFLNNLQHMKDAGCTVYLRASTAALIQRLSNSATRRPLLEGKDINAALEELYRQRNPFFTQADYIFDIDSITVSKFENIVSSCTNRP